MNVALQGAQTILGQGGSSSGTSSSGASSSSGAGSSTSTTAPPATTHDGAGHVDDGAGHVEHRAERQLGLELGDPVRRAAEHDDDHGRVDLTTAAPAAKSANSSKL